MDSYVFVGKVLPERALLNYKVGVRLQHITSGRECHAEVSILLNHLHVTVTTEEEWDIFDLRNVVQSLVSGQLAAVGYLLGRHYDLEITRVVNAAAGVDDVFGIEVPCVSGRVQEGDLNDKMLSLRKKLIGDLGIFIDRCLVDLNLAMKRADDTPFYCYRAIESLRHHCAAAQGHSASSEKEQWKSLAGIVGRAEADIEGLKSKAGDLRHGKPAHLTGEERADILKLAFETVDAYLTSLPEPFVE